MKFLPHGKGCYTPGIALFICVFYALPMTQNAEGCERKTRQESLAHIAYEANRAYCRSIGDYSHKPWDEAPEWQRASCMQGIEGALQGKTAEESHQNWLRVKEKEGWVYGETKDPDKKTHPCMMPFDQLPEDQQVKDSIYLAVIQAAAPYIKD